MDAHVYIPFLAALIPLFIGFIWYHPKVFGKAWMAAAEMTEEKTKVAKMGLMFTLTYIFSVLVAFSLISITIHQVHMLSITANDPSAADPTSETGMYVKSFFEKYGNIFRTF